MSVSKDHQRRVRNSSKRRRPAIIQGPCVICGVDSKIAHHVIPVRYDGGFGANNMMPACGLKHHSRLNKISNGWVRRNKDKRRIMKPGELADLCRQYILKQIEHAKRLRIKRQLEREGLITVVSNEVEENGFYMRKKFIPKRGK